MPIYNHFVIIQLLQLQMRSSKPSIFGNFQQKEPQQPQLTPKVDPNQVKEIKIPKYKAFFAQRQGLQTPTNKVLHKFYLSNGEGICDQLRQLISRLFEIKTPLEQQTNRVFDQFNQKIRDRVSNIEIERDFYQFKQKFHRINQKASKVNQMKLDFDDIHRRLDNEFKRVTRQKEDETRSLKSKINDLEGRLQLSQKDVDHFREKTSRLNEQISRLNKEKIDIEKVQSDLQMEKLNRMAFEEENVNLTKGYTKFYEQNVMLKQKQEKVRSDFEAQKVQLERVKEILITYDQKVSFLETALDSCQIDRNDFQCMNQDQEIRLNEMESVMKEQIVTISQAMEHKALLVNEKKILYSEIEQKQVKIDDLLAEIDSFRFQLLQQKEQAKQVQCRLILKDEQLSKITYQLSQRNKMLKQIRSQSVILENLLKEKVEQLVSDNDKKEERIEKHKGMIMGQLLKIEQQDINLEILKKQIVDFELILEVKSNEQNQLKATIAEQAQKIDVLISERNEIEIQFKKSSQLLEKTQNEFYQCKKSSFEVNQKLKQVEDKINLLNNDKIVLEKQLKIANKVISQLQQEVKLSKTENMKLNKIAKQLEEKVWKGGIDIGFLKQERHNGQSEKKRLNKQIQKLCLQMDKLKKDNFALEKKVNEMQIRQAQAIKINQKLLFENEQLSKKELELEKSQEQMQKGYTQMTIMNQKLMLQKKELNEKQLESQKREIEFERMRQYLHSRQAQLELTVDSMDGEMRRINEISQARLQQLMNFLSQPIEKEETSKFELMSQEQEFQMMQCAQQRYRRQVKQQINKYREQILFIFKNDA